MPDMETPRYRLVKPFYVDDMYIEEGRVIDFDGTPNDQMEPMNEPARVKMEAYIKSLNDGARAAGRDSRHLADIAYQEVHKRPREPERIITMPEYKPDVPPMANLHKVGQKPVVKEPSVKIQPVVEPTKGPAPIAISSIHKDNYNDNP